MAVAYSKPGDGNMDTLYFCSSSNGGMSFDNKRIVTLSNHHIEKVSLSFGRSLSKPEGRYFVAWDEKNPAYAATGHIYTAHTEPYFNSSFTKPVCLDSLDPAAINMGRNPSIACQLNNVNNDSINLTEVVLFDKFNSSTQRYDISGYYNLQATSHTNFKKLNISNSAHYNIQPSINFNHFDSTFMVTYYDSTTQKLIYLLNDFNLENPDNWQFISTGYNDSSHLAAPYPKVVLNQDQKKGANVWVSEGLIGNGVAMFDAPYSTYTGGTENIFSRKEGFSVYPNPCKSNIIIDFELQKASNVTIAIYNLIGQEVGMITNQDYSSGKHELKCSVNLLPGSYLCSYKTDDFLTTQKLMVIR